MLDCIQRLYTADITVRAVTCDGTEVNLSMFRHLGVETDKPYFGHPSNSEVTMFLVCDVCHMLQLVRNTLGDLKILQDSDNNQIRWAHITALLDVQESAWFRAANKLSVKHIKYRKRIMKVKLAAQVLSSSVADALEFLREDCSDTRQKDNEATVNFVRKIHHLFDLLNSRSPFARGFEAALRCHNMRYWTECLSELRDYISALKTVDGTLLLNHRRKTAFVGFIISISSVIGLATELLTRDVNPFKYFLTYKLSQDHLELFFSKIRSKGGSITIRLLYSSEQLIGR